ncbi:MAG: histidine phosphatase family protein [Actinomyces sp.]|nr:MAG: histidine phosphatase family protein [Actinomyces sp.]
MLIVVRHGRTVANAAGELLGRRDPPLDPEGERQAEAVARRLGRPALVVSSPLRRARQTAARLAPGHRVDERFVELDYGELDGTPVAEVDPAVWTRWRAEPDWRPPGGETLTELGERVRAGLEDLVEVAADDDVVVVTHVSPVKAAVAWALGVGVEISWRCYVAPASITRIAWRAGAPSLVSFDETAHLDALSGPTR